MGVYYIQKPDELYHYGVRGMKWGIRHDRPNLTKSQKRSLKASYKENDKALKKQAHQNWRNYVDADRAIRKDYRTGKKQLRSKVKSGTVTKDQYKNSIKRARRIANAYSDSQEYKMAIAQYHVKKARRANKLIYIGSVKGRHSKAYKRGMNHLASNTESWANYTITNNNGKYKVTRTEYVYY